MQRVLPPPNEWSAADLVEHFGPIPLRRIRANPAPGTATEQDVVEIHDREGRLYELADGVLVEKTVGTQESFLTAVLTRRMGDFADLHDLGFVLGADGMARLNPGLIRIPDVSFISWKHFPNRKVPAVPMLDLAPDLAVEVLSPSNTRKEMERKLHDYFEAGVALVWYVDPADRSVQVFHGPDESAVLEGHEVLSGESVLPGFELPLPKIFERLA